jgi:hypothetical protein
MMQRKQVVGPGGRPLTVADLSSPHTKRWVIQRKAEVVAAVRGGLLSLEQACSRYALNAEEFRAWERFIDRFGVKGLRTTRNSFTSISSPPPERRKKDPDARGIIAPRQPGARIHHSGLRIDAIPRAYSAKRESALFRLVLAFIGSEHAAAGHF